MNLIQKLLLGVVSVQATVLKEQSSADGHLKAPPPFKKKLETIKDDVEHVDELFKDVSLEQAQMIDKMEQDHEAAIKNITITKNAQIDTLNEKVTTLNTAATAANDQISQLTATVSEADQKIATLETAANAANEQIAELTVAAQEDDAKITELETAANAANDQIAQLSVAAQEDDAKIDELETAAAVADEQIAQLTAAAESSLDSRCRFKDDKVTPNHHLLDFFTRDSSRFNWNQDITYPCADEYDLVHQNYILTYEKENMKGPWQWYGWQTTPNSPYYYFRMSAWVMFEDTIPAATANFGFKIHGAIHNDQFADMTPGVWKYISHVGQATGGDSGYCIFIFDQMQGPQKVHLAEMSLEIFDSVRDPIS